MTDQAIIQELQQIRKDQKRILSLLEPQRKGKQWVKASDILRITGWNREKLRQRRADGSVEFRKTAKGWFYNPDSIHPYLIRHENTNPRAVGMDGIGSNPEKVSA